VSRRLGSLAGGALLLGLLAASTAGGGAVSAAKTVYRIDRVTDGDTIVLRNDQRVRLIQIDSPEKFFGLECYAREASDATELLLPEGTRVRLLVETAGDRIDDFDRLLRYVVRLDGVNVNLRLVALGAAAPYFYEGQRGRYAARLEALAKRARGKELGLWGACPGTRYDPYHGIETHSSSTR
jgi:endonuclease YncB( thermonuclease family)